MTARVRLALAATTLAALASLVACADPVTPTAPTSDGTMPGSEPDGTDVGASEPSQLVPEECADAYPLAVAPAEIAEISLMPADWPAPPEGAALCLTSEAVDGSTESAFYATQAPAEAILGHYEAALSGYELFRADGAETGTGYMALDGVGADVSFQVRETDGGFALVFAAEVGR